MQTFLREWKLSESDLENFSDSPIENIKNFAENKTPAIILPKDEEQFKILKGYFPKTAKNITLLKDGSDIEKTTQTAVKFLSQKPKKKK